MEQAKLETPGKYLFRLIYPYLLYSVLTRLIMTMAVLAGSMGSILQKEQISVDEMMNIVNEYVQSHAMVLTAIAGAVLIPVLYFFYWRDERYYKVEGFYNLKKINPVKYVFAVCLGVFVCLFLNQLITLLSVKSISSGYQVVESNRQEAAIWLQLVATVIIAPIEEELLFRGLLFKRMRRQQGFYSSMIVSSLIFGLVHGNLVQFIYAMMAGMFFAFVFEAYKNIWAPIIMHMAANLVSVVVTVLAGNIQVQIYIFALIMLGFGAAIYLFYKIIDNNVVRERADVLEETAQTESAE